MGREPSTSTCSNRTSLRELGPWAKKSGVQNVYTVSSHDDFYCLGRLESVQLVEQLQHCPLNFRVSPLSLHSGPSDGVHLVDKDDAGCVLSSHHKEFSHHPGPLSNILLDQL